MSEKTNKKAFPLRISSRLFDQIREWAEQDLRSINGQIEFLLAAAVRNRNQSFRDSTEETPTQQDDTDPSNSG